MDMKAGNVAMQATREAAMTVPKLQVELEKYMRALWDDHVFWTRMAIISIAAGSPDTDQTVARLLRNPVDLEKVFAVYYGDQTAAAVRELLKDHLTIAAELVMAAKLGDSKKATGAETRWYANADEIASALHSINPNWEKEPLAEMLYEHLKMTKDEAVARLDAVWGADIQIFDKVRGQAQMMADSLTEGIVMQFPDRFEA